MMIDGNPIAQSFTVSGTASAGLPGIFLTQLGVFFKKKSSSASIYCAVVEMNNGVPDPGKRIGSAALSPQYVTISEDASSETIFEFDKPLMLTADKEYAFYLYPASNSTDYEMWVSEIGGKDTLTGNSITQQPYPGALFVSSNGSTWNPILTQDIKFNLYRAKFTSSGGTLALRNKPDEYFSLDLSVASGGIQKKTTGTQIQVGDIVYAANATSLTSILTTNNTLYPLGYVKSVDEVSGILFLENSNGKFTNNSSTPNYSNIRIYRTPDPANTSYITETYRIANAIISTIDDLKYNAFVPKFSISEPTGTYVTTEYTGTSNTTYTVPNAKDTVAAIPLNETLYENRDYERVVRSYSNEVAAGTYGTTGTATYNIKMTTYSPYVSPIINLKARSFNYIQNVINNDDYNEWTRYGNAKTKYISKTVVLNTPAEDLIVYITAYKPAGTNIKAYAKFFNADTDPGTFDTKVWTELSYLNNGNNLYCSPNNINDLKEFSFSPPKSAARPSGNTTLSAYSDTTSTPYANLLTYYDENNVIHKKFNMFSIKLVMLATDGAKYPIMADVRAIALLL
jgi:hypothetical protein